MIDFGAERAVYRQLADLLRDQITSGQIAPGDLLPYEGRLVQEYGVSRETVRRALQVLRVEGLVVTERGYGTRVVEERQREQVRVPRGARVRSRMPTAAEREELGIDLAAVVPVLVVTLGGRVRGVTMPINRLTCGN